MILPGEQQGGGIGMRRRRVSDGEENSNRTTPEAVGNGEMDDLEDEEEEEQRSNEDGSSEAEEADADAARPSTSGTRTNSTSSTANDGAGGVAVPTKTQAAFVGKLWSMLCTPALSHLIAWTDDGKAFTVFHPTEFARTVLPQFFKHSNFASFIRQLNMYGFGKRVNDALGGSTSQMNSDGSQVQAWEFQNPAFQRDRPDLLARIRRKSAKPSVAVVSAPSSRRRPSIVRGVSSKSRRDLNGSDGGEDDEEPAPRVERGAQSHPPTPSVLFGDSAVPLPSNGIKVVAGLTEFVPQGSQPDSRAHFRPRPKEEHFEGTVRSPTAYNRQQAPYPPPIPPPPGSYYHPHPSSAHPSPRSSMYPLGPPPFYSQARPPPPPEDSSARQIVALESQVRSFGEALFHTQQDYMASRAASYSVLGMLLGIVADMDVGESRKEQIELCSAALSKLHPDVHMQSSFPPQLPTPSSNLNYPSYPLPPPPPNNQSLASHQISNYHHYNKIPPVESYTRSSRPDSALSREGHPNNSQPSTNLPPSFRPPSNPQSLVRPNSPNRPSTSGSSNTQPTPSGLAGQQPSNYSNWPSANPNSSRPTSLPSLSSLLEGVPANGERRGEGDQRESEPERIRKKMRQ
ncbi:hypothetical protein JCM3765_004866 [Sporobolomyces pararoseus]